MSARTGVPARHGLRGAIVLAAAALAAAAPAPATAATGPAAAPAQPAATKILSDRHTFSHWAYPASESPVRATPSRHGRRVGRLRLLTGDAQAELYVALASRQAADGTEWIEIEVPGRPNGREGWVPAA